MSKKQIFKNQSPQKPRKINESIRKTQGSAILCKKEIRLPKNLCNE